MREIRTLGSVEGALGDRRLYSNITIPDLRDHDAPIQVITIAEIRMPMARLDDLAPGTWIRGVLPDGLVCVVDVKWHGSQSSS